MLLWSFAPRRLRIHCVINYVTARQGVRRFPLYDVSQSDFCLPFDRGCETFCFHIIIYGISHIHSFEIKVPGTWYKLIL
jgi:hypothetical protein